MSLSVNYDELVVDWVRDPAPSLSTIAVVSAGSEQLAWHEFADGPPERTPRSAWNRAARYYLPELGRWVKNCAVCGTAFTSKRRHVGRGQPSPGAPLGSRVVVPSPFSPSWADSVQHRSRRSDGQFAALSVGGVEVGEGCPEALRRRT